MCRFPASQNLNLPEIYDFMVAGPKMEIILSQSHITKGTPLKTHKDTLKTNKADLRAKKRKILTNNQ